MMTFGGTLTIPDMSKLDPDTLVKLLHFHAEEIAQPVLDRIESRTPVETGALQEDETYELPGEGDTLVSWYAGSDYQEAEWHRPYAAYQEGPPLGETTYTNGPHQMFARVATDDLLLIQAWANRVLAEGLDNMVGEATANPLSEVFE